ncbi:prepilin peptidase [Actinobaculum suis]|uniref:prepilin peptidase n=1 Tax=Actinobaculum suis TaxID=1657 RepID=UPI0009F2CBF0|nr:prepilin peptidase [Actinobaculum suis]
MPFWSRERILRGVLTGWQALGGGLATAAAAFLALIFVPPLNLLAPGTGTWEIRNTWQAPSAIAQNIAHRGSTEEPFAQGIEILAGCAVLACLAVAAYIDQTLHILPDPLLALAGAGAAMAALAGRHPENIAAGIGFAGLGYLLNKVTVFGRGDAKFMGVLGLWLGPVGAALACGIAVIGAAGLSLAAIVADYGVYGITSQYTLAFGPWLFTAGFLVWVALC